MGRRPQGSHCREGHALKRIFQAFLLLALIAIAFLTYRFLFPGDEARIRKVLERAAIAGSVTGNEGDLGRLTKAAELASICTKDIQVTVDAVGLRGGLEGRDSVRNAAMRFGTTFGNYRIQLANIHFRELAETSAKVTLTARFEGAAPAEIDAQEFAIGFQKVDGNWLIARVETVRLLKR